MSLENDEMTREETIQFLKKEIEMYKRLIKQEQSKDIKFNLIKTNVWLENYKAELKKLEDELKQLSFDY